MFNIHAHIFTVRDIPVDFLKDAGIPPWIGRSMVRNLQAGGARRRMAEMLIGNTAQGKKFKAFVNIGSQKTMSMVFDTMRYDNDYPDGTKFVALPMQFEWMAAGNCEAHNYDDQIGELVQTKAENPDVLFPFYAIDPRMGTSEEEVLSYVQRHLTMAIPTGKDEKGNDIYSRVFYGIKLYPSLGFFPYDPFLRATYRYAEENELPIMTHTSRGGIYYSGKRSEITGIYGPKTMNRIDPCLLPYNSTNKSQPVYMEPKYKYPDIDNAKVPNAEFCDYFLDPENYVDALGLFPKLKICFAHFGSDSEIATKLNINIGEETKPAPGSPRNDTWYDKVVALLRKTEYPNLFTDISYTLHIAQFRKLVKDEVEGDLKINGTNKLEERLISKILFGTDFFMVYREEGETEKSLVVNAKKDFLDITQTSYPNLYALGPTKLWEYMTVINPKRYLSSKIATF